MERRNLDFEIPLTREQWDQLGQAANFRPDYGVLRWSPSEPDVIQLSVREDDRPTGWDVIAPPVDDLPPEDREVARFVYNDGRTRVSIRRRSRRVRPSCRRRRRSCSARSSTGCAGSGTSCCGCRGFTTIAAHCLTRIGRGRRERHTDIEFSATHDDVGMFLEAVLRSLNTL
jgi:hypothetical protein